MSKYFNSVVAVALLFTTTIFAQDEKSKVNFQPGPPVNFEAVIGSRGVMYQLLVNKKFQSIPKLGFFSITNANAPWDKEIIPDIMTQAHLTYNLFKGLDVTAGMQYSPNYTFRPVSGLIYSYTSPDIVVIVNPKIDLVDDFAMEHMAMIEYKPSINERFRFYSRIQGLYGFVPESGAHNRSYIMLRAGLSFSEFTFGAASNFDWYGPVKLNETNIGVFVSALLF